MTTIWSAMPMVTCPHCKKEFQVDDYYNLHTGDSFECNHCEKEIYIHSLDTIIECNLGTDPST